MPYCKKHPDDINTERGFNGAELRSERRSATGISSATVPGGNSATVPGGSSATVPGARWQNNRDSGASAHGHCSIVGQNCQIQNGNGKLANSNLTYKKIGTDGIITVTVALQCNVAIEQCLAKPNQRCYEVLTRSLL